MYFSEKKSENSELALNHLKLIRYWHRPGGGLVEVIEKMKEKKITDPTLLDKSYVELYIGSLFGIGLQESEKIDFWIAKPNNDPPDMFFMTMLMENQSGVKFHSREVEITRYVKKEDNLLNIILNKVNNKSYPKDYVIVCFLEVFGFEDLKKLSEELVKKIKNIENIFLIFHGVPLSDLKKSILKEDVIGKVTIVQVSPQYNIQVIDIPKSLEIWRADNKKLAHVDNMKVYYGFRELDTEIPKIISQLNK